MLENVDFGANGTWLDPLSKESKTVMSSSEDAWTQLDAVYSQCVVATCQAMLDDTPHEFERLHWSGWLRRERGTWKCQRLPGTALRESTPLFVIVRPSLNEPLRLVEIGRSDESGYCEIDSYPNLVEGLPVFSTAKR